MDEVQGCFEPSEEPFELLGPDDLELPDAVRFLRRPGVTLSTILPHKLGWGGGPARRVSGSTRGR